MMGGRPKAEGWDAVADYLYMNKDKLGQGGFSQAGMAPAGGGLGYAKAPTLSPLSGMIPQQPPAFNPFNIEQRPQARPNLGMGIIGRGR